MNHPKLPKVLSMNPGLLVLKQKIIHRAFVQNPSLF